MFHTRKSPLLVADKLGRVINRRPEDTPELLKVLPGGFPTDPKEFEDTDHAFGKRVVLASHNPMRRRTNVGRRASLEQQRINLPVQRQIFDETAMEPKLPQIKEANEEIGRLANDEMKAT